ncbi:MAG TPA: flavodoxin domain-containing protein [bacterium]
MKTLIIYTTQHGCTEECAIKLQQQLNSDAELINIKKQKSGNLDDFKTIIIGGSIHAGQIQRKIKKFCQENLDKLKQKKLGLFLCCMEEGEKAQKQFQDAFPTELIQHATTTGIFGGEFNFEKMNFIEKAIIKKIAKIEKSVSKIDEKSILEFAEKIKD